MDQKKSVSFEKLLQAVALGNKEPEVISSIAVRISRMAKKLDDSDKAEIQKHIGDSTLKDLTADLVNSINPDRHMEHAKQTHKTEQPTEEQIRQVATEMIQKAVKPLYNPNLRNRLIEFHKKVEQTIDHVSQDKIIEAGFSADALEKAKNLIQSFEKFIQDHKDEITALQILYSKPYKARLRFEDIKDLANAIQKPPYLWTESQLWQAYSALDKSKVRGAGAKRILTDLVSLVRFAIRQDNELVPFPERVNVNFKSWVGQQENMSKKFTDEQKHWLQMIKNHIAANLSIEKDDFDFAPFAQEGGIGKVYQLFGDDVNKIISELNEMLAA
jgi:type I restriction enzyme R subunit